MIDIEKTEAYEDWFRKLGDGEGKARINKRLKRIHDDGNFGDIKGVGDGVSEIRFHFGSGYRIYYVERDETVILLLGGGDKDSQDRDIQKVKVLADAVRKDWEEARAKE